MHIIFYKTLIHVIYFFIFLFTFLGRYIFYFYFYSYYYYMYHSAQKPELVKMCVHTYLYYTSLRYMNVCTQFNQLAEPLRNFFISCSVAFGICGFRSNNSNNSIRCFNIRSSAATSISFIVSLVEYIVVTTRFQFVVIRTCVQKIKFKL